MKPTQENVHKILVVTLSNLGDVVLTLPVFQSLLEAFPEAELDVIVGAGAREVFEGDSRICRIIAYDKRASWAKKWAFLSEIRGRRYDLIIDLRRSPIGLLGGAKFHNSYLEFSRRTRHRAQKHLAALRGIAPVSARSLFLNTDDRLVSRFLGAPDGTSRWVAAAVGSKSDVKKWPAASYAKLLDRLAINDACRVVLVGDRNDARDAEKVKSLMMSEVTDLTGKTDFRELVSVIGRASIVVTNDSAPLHIAEALRVPVLAVFGPTDPRRYGPRAAGSAAVHLPLFCVPCEKAQCRYGHECLKTLDAGEVYKKAEAVLKDKLRPRSPKILVIRLDRIGDVVLSLPAIEAVKNHFPEASISMMVRAQVCPLVQDHPLVEEVIPYDYARKGRHGGVVGNARFIREIIRRRFDIVFILNPSVRSYLVPFVAGIPYRVGFRTGVPFLLTHSAPDRRSEGRKHEAEYTLDVVRAFGITAPRTVKSVWPVSEDRREAIERRLEKWSVARAERLIAIHAGASCPSKRWPKERFALFGRKMLETFGHRLVVIGGSEEKDLGRYLTEALGARAVDLTGELDLSELAALFGRCELLVSNDSGPVHVAAAVGTPTLAIFGRTERGLSATRWKALGAGHAVIQKDVGCVVCLAHRCTIDFECLKAVEVEEVFETARRMIVDREPVPLAK